MSGGEKESERRQHNRVKNAGLGAKPLDLHRSFATFQLRLHFFICKMKILLTLISWGCCGTQLCQSIVLAKYAGTQMLNTCYPLVRVIHKCYPLVRVKHTVSQVISSMTRGNFYIFPFVRMEKHHSSQLLQEVVKNAAECWWQQEVIPTFQMQYVFHSPSGRGLRMLFGRSGPVLIHSLGFGRIFIICFVWGKHY